VTRYGVELAPGTARTVAGAQTTGTIPAAGAPARSVQLDVVFSPHVTRDEDGNLYMAESLHNDIVRIDGKGFASVYAGVAAGPVSETGYTPPGRSRTETTVVRPGDALVDRDGKTVLYAGEEEFEVRAIDPEGIVRQVAGNGLYRYCGDGLMATSTDPRFEPQVQMHTEFSGENAATANPAGEVFIAEPDNHTIRKVGLDGRLSTVIGHPQPCAAQYSCPGRSTGDGGPYADATLNRPRALAADDQGLFVLDEDFGFIRYANFSDRTAHVLGVDVAPGKIERVVGRQDRTTCTASTTTVADTGETIEPVNARDACLSPWSFALGHDDELFIAQFAGGAVWRVDRNGMLSLVAGRPASFGRTAEATATATDPSDLERLDRYRVCKEDGGTLAGGRLCPPLGIAITSDDNIYVTTWGGSSFSSLDPTAEVFKPFAAMRIDFLNRSDHAVTVHGITVPPGEWRRVAGKLRDDTIGCPPASGDGGPARSAEFCTAYGLAAVGDTVYLTDEYNNRIRAVDSTGTIDLVAGGASPNVPIDPNVANQWTGGYEGDGGPAASARLFDPLWLEALPGTGTQLLEADALNHRVRLIVDCDAARAPRAGRPAVSPC
jgi:hypothetical protein